MAIVSKEALKDKFQKGDLPTENDFGDLIDSCYNTTSGSSSFSLSGLVVHQIGNSGDGNGYDTLELHPDLTRSQYDQYLIIDPTAPNHIHIRAGGDQDNSNAQLFIGGEDTYYSIGTGPTPTAYIRSTYNVSIEAYNSDTSSQYNWYLNNNGTMMFPDQTSNNRTGSGNTLKFGHQGSQYIIASQGGTQASPTVERLVVAGGDSYQDPDTSVWSGEGGDIYLWAGYGNDGGDIKVDAGNGYVEGGSVKVRGGNVTNSSTLGNDGGFVEIRSGSGHDGGNIDIYSGYGSYRNGGNINIGSGSGSTAGGSINIVAASSGGTDGRVNITAGDKTIIYTGSAPGTSVGSAGDTLGMIAIEADYIYYCTGNYDGTTDIWKRVAFSNDTW